MSYSGLSVFEMRQPLHSSAFILLLAVAITACSLKSIYNRLDFLIPEYVEGMVTLDDSIEGMVEQRSLMLLNWHRNTQLKLYADWLLTIQRDTGNRLTEEIVEQRIAEAEQFWRTLAVRINDEMALLLPLLDEDQKAELFSNIEERNEEFREEFVELDEDDRIDDYIESMTDTYEYWIGDLTGTQALAVETAASGLLSTAELRMQRRVAWQGGIRKILEEAESIENKSEKLRQFLAGFEDINNQALKVKTEINRGIITALTVEILNSMTKQQRQHFIEKTNEYIRILNELAENR